MIATAYDLAMACPLCGHENVHFELRALMRDGQDAGRASQHVRGGTLAFPFWCEGGCDFALVFGFHKGSSFLWAETTAGKVITPRWSR